MKTPIVVVLVAAFLCALALVPMITNATDTLSADLFVPISSGTIGAVLTSSTLTSGSIGTSNWNGYLGSVPTAFTIVTSTIKRIASILVNGTTYSTSYPANAIAEDDSKQSQTFVDTFPAGHKQATFSGFITFGPPQQTSNEELHDYWVFADGSGNEASMQLDDEPTRYALNIETNPGGVTTHSPFITLTPGATYWVSFNINFASGTTQVALYDPSNFTQIGYASNTLTASGQDIVDFQFGNNEAGVSTSTSYFQDMILNYTSAPFPLGPGRLNFATATHTVTVVPSAGVLSVSGIAANNGNTIILTPATTTPVTVSFQISDSNGCSAVFSGGTVTTTLYMASAATTTACTPNNLSCYVTTSTTNNCSSGNTANATATLNMYYFADSTGNPSSSYPSNHWYATVQLKDTSSATTTATSTTGVDVGVMTAVSLSSSNINYGTVALGSNTGSTDQTVVVNNAGNSSSTLQVSGTALSLGAKNIATSSQHYATTSFTYGGTEQLLNGSPTTISGFLLTAPTSTTNVSGTIYWGIAIPNGNAPGIYTGTTTLSAVFSS